jgi:endo-1,4-beta-xylanase
VNQLSRRLFLKTGATAGAATALIGPAAWARPLSLRRDSIVMRPYPHPIMPAMNWAYATDAFHDPFESPIAVTHEGVLIPETMGGRPFAVNARWFVPDFGYVWLTADNQGRLYSADDFRGDRVRNLNVEFARSYVAKNEEALSRYGGTRFSPEVRHLTALSEELLEKAERSQGEVAGDAANRSLRFSLLAGEKIEYEHAWAVLATPRPGEFFFGCETRQFFWARSEETIQRFIDVFNFATITHYIDDTWYEPFEPREGEYRWGLKDNIVDWLVDHDITIQGRPLFWFHPSVTPDWLASKSYEELLAYADTHVENLVGHYGDKVLQWEIVNEYHDWANVHNFSEEQITDFVRFACEKTHQVNPEVVRIINNCCPYAEYAPGRRAAHGASDRPLRSPRKFMADIVEAEVPFDVTGLQMYFPQRSIGDIVRHVERFAAFGKPVYITEIGTTSGPTRTEIMLESMPVQGPLFQWRRPWDEELQADWMEQLYTIFYSKPYIQAVNWYDFADFRTFIQNGGLIREDATPKASYRRLQNLLAEWDRLPEPRTTR